mmetsp:Transcript_30215/g.49318  ORF Transcript_30215/g.49318 Transcript_30215/m.49318 type:complete len:235 (+) Transcript_30215:74-778(+)
MTFSAHKHFSFYHRQLALRRTLFPMTAPRRPAARTHTPPFCLPPPSPFPTGCFRGTAPGWRPPPPPTRRAPPAFFPRRRGRLRLLLLRRGRTRGASQVSSLFPCSRRGGVAPRRPDRPDYPGDCTKNSQEPSTGDTSQGETGVQPRLCVPHTRGPPAPLLLPLPGGRAGDARGTGAESQVESRRRSQRACRERSQRSQRACREGGQVRPPEAATSASPPTASCKWAGVLLGQRW